MDDGYRDDDDYIDKLVDEGLRRAKLAYEKPKETEDPRPAFSIIDPTGYEGLHIPERRWIVPDWLPVGHVTLNYGDGGTGKTLLTQQLMTSCATAKPWCGLAVEPCRAFALFCEDDEDELHRRQADICDAYGISFSDLGDMRWVSAVGADNLLVTFDADSRPYPTERFTQLREAVTTFGARLVILDTAADTFGGNENDRAQVRQFIGNILTGLARDIDGAVILNAHPSRSGLSASGDLDGGSTGWSNSARSRWGLARPAGEDVPADTPERVLSRRKANYASKGTEIRLRWQQGVLAPQERPHGLAAAASHAECERVFLDLLARCDSANLPVSASHNAGNYAPKTFGRRSDRCGYERRDFEAAMSRLLSAGAIVLVNYGRSGDERRRIAAAPQAGESAA